SFTPGECTTMRRSSMVLSLMAVVLMVGGTLFGASKTEPAAKGKGHLPTHWTKLILTDEQKVHLRELALKNLPSPTPPKEVTKPDTKPENKPAPDNKLAPKDT